MGVLAGTSGWQYRDWRGAFYPSGVPQRRWLEHYASQFATVENNGTFYRLPAPEVFASWRERVPGDFVMTVKASRYLTHVRRLRDPADPVRRLLAAAAGLGGRLGPVLLQLPPDMRAAPELLRECLRQFPAAIRVAVGAQARVLVDRRGAGRARGAGRGAVLGGPQRIGGHAAVADGRLGLPAVARGRWAAVAKLPRRHAGDLGRPDHGQLGRRPRGVRVLQQRPELAAPRDAARLAAAIAGRGGQAAPAWPGWEAGERPEGRRGEPEGRRESPEGRRERLEARGRVRLGGRSTARSAAGEAETCRGGGKVSSFGRKGFIVFRQTSR